jgi:hypothetical protein
MKGIQLWACREKRKSVTHTRPRHRRALSRIHPRLKHAAKGTAETSSNQPSFDRLPCRVHIPGCPLCRPLERKHERRCGHSRQQDCDGWPLSGTSC